MAKSILIIGTLDTKGKETLYLKEKIAALGLSPIVMDISMRESQDSSADITAASSCSNSSTAID